MINLAMTGNLTKDPWVGTTKNGKSMCTFDMAVESGLTSHDGEKELIFAHIVTFDSLAENCARFLKKGRYVAVTAKSIKPEAYMGRDNKPRSRFNVNAVDVEFGPGRDGVAPADKPESASAEAAPTAAARNYPEGFVEVTDPDELPF